MCGAYCGSLERLGGDRLSRVLGRSTMGAEGFHGRVRNGIGCFAPRYSHQVVRANPWFSRSLTAQGPALVRAWLCAGLRRGFGCLEIWRSVSRRSGEPGRLRRPFVQAVEAVQARRCMRSRMGSNQADRAIRIGKLNALPRFHIRPIDVVVYHGSSGRPRLEGGFPLRCIQRLSRPHIATRRCRWRDNRYTRGASIPVLSY